MSRYKYLGPYDVIEIQGQTVPRNGEFDATDDAFIEDQRRRGVHLFEPVTVATGPATETLAIVAEQDKDTPVEE